MPVSVTSSSRASRVASTNSNPLPRIGSWQLVGLLGEGAWTSVYQARPLDCTSDGAGDYAVKILKPEHRENSVAIELLRREAAVASTVSHPHLTTVLTWHFSQSPRYLVMPRLTGGTIRLLLDRSTSGDVATGNPLAVPHALWIIRQVTEGLLALHSAGWVHGDVKPSNIFVSPQGHATLIDLGFARKINGNASHSISGERREVLAASPAYAAPEVLGDNHYGCPQSDIYSLGVTLFEMVTGQRPYATTDPAELVACHLQEQPRDPKRLAPNLWPRVVRLLQRMLDKDPSWRPHAAELHDVLMRLEIETLLERAASV